MDMDISANSGDNRKPVVILIHGLGMDKTIWENPIQARFFGGSLPVSMLLTKPPSQKDCRCSEKKTSSLSSGFTTGVRPRSLRTIFHDLRAKDYSVIAWSQKRPVGNLAEAVKELSEVIPLAKRLSENGIILVGHSR